MSNRVFLGSSNELAGSFNGVCRREGGWAAVLDVEGTQHQLGIFESMYRAAQVYDMEALRAFGKYAPDLNFKYEVLEENEEKNSIKLLDSSGVTMSVDVCPNQTSYGPVGVSYPIFSKSLSSTQEAAVLSTKGAPPLPDSTRSWHDRNSTLYIPSASFLYEITFPHVKSLGLNLKPNYIRYSPESDQFIGALVVVEAAALLSSLVYPGDIIIQINGINMCTYGSNFNFDRMTSLITSATPPRTVKFLRPSGPSHTLSPAEICLFLGLSADQCATNTAELISTPGPPHSAARFNVVISSTGASQSLQLVYLESSAPLALKRLMQGMKVSWEGNPAQKVFPDVRKKDLSSDENLSTPEIFLDTSTSPANPDGYTRKWVAQLVIQPDQYDTEYIGTTDNVTEIIPTAHDSTSTSLSSQAFGTISCSVESKKRKRGDFSKPMSSVDIAYRKKLQAAKQYEKVFFLGKFDTEADARAVLMIAKKETAANGGFFIPHKITPPVRTLQHSSTIPASTTSLNTVSSLPTVTPVPSTIPSTATPTNRNSTPFYQPPPQPPTRDAPLTNPPPPAAATVTNATRFESSFSAPKSIPDPFNRNTKIRIKRLTAMKAVSFAFRNNGPHSINSMNMGFSTFKHVTYWNNDERSSSNPSLSSLPSITAHLHENK